MIKSTGFLVLMIFFSVSCKPPYTGMIMTVNGPVSPDQMGISLTHEHILVDFVGADSISYDRWEREKVIEKALPFLMRAKKNGCRTLVECTPVYIGRDPLLLKSVADRSGLHIITNTGYYGAAENRYMPKHAHTETADELAGRWINEWKKGIEETGVKPGFIKIGVMDGELSDLHRKIVRAAARTHLETGMVIASHTGPAIPAFAQLGVLYEEGVSPEAFIWVHSQSEKDSTSHVIAAQMGAWISFDGLNDDNPGEYLKMIQNMKDKDLLDRVLLSHDAGWYHPGEEDGGYYRGYTTLFETLLPLLKSEGFTDDEINKLLVTNPADAFAIGIHKVYE